MNLRTSTDYVPQCGEVPARLTVAKSSKIDRHEAVADACQTANNQVTNFERPRHLLDRQFDACKLAVMTDAELTKTESGQHVLCLLDLSQQLWGDGHPVRDARGKARGGGFVPHGQAEHLSYVAHRLFRKSAFEEG